MVFALLPCWTWLGKAEARNRCTLQFTISRNGIKDRICVQGEEGQYLLESGVGSVLGVMEVLAGRNRMRTATAETAVESFTLPAKLLLDLCATDPQMELKAFQLAGATLAASSNLEAFEGSSFDELVTSFGTSSRLVQGPSPGGHLILPEAAILVHGTVMASAHRPFNSAFLKSKRIKAVLYVSPWEGAGEEVSAPAFLAQGKYSVVTSSQVRNHMFGLKCLHMDWTSLFH